ncbi:MAG: hypothetical protein NUV74_05545 [Candidatus Brocadiaceae bacterium]|nr:hypothetical protein [Candidatus Brocadiaceae bacterium]
MKIKWKVSAISTGRWRSFYPRRWPMAQYEDQTPCASIYCEDGYVPSLVKTENHAPLVMMIADYSITPWKWRKVKITFKTLQEAKDWLSAYLAGNPSTTPKDLNRR